jgi:hypothetical protein
MTLSPRKLQIRLAPENPRGGGEHLACGAGGFSAFAKDSGIV